VEAEEWQYNLGAFITEAARKDVQTRMQINYSITLCELHKDPLLRSMRVPIPLGILG